jgi:hypothetical protein
LHFFYFGNQKNYEDSNSAARKFSFRDRIIDWRSRGFVRERRYGVVGFEFIQQRLFLVRGCHCDWLAHRVRLVEKG